MIVHFSNIASALIGAGASLLGGAIQNWQGNKEYRRTQHLMDKQNDMNIANWEMQNDYNLPKNQIQRLKDAGLNPDLFYQNGASGLVSGEIGSASAGSAPVGFTPDLNPMMQGIALDSQIELNKSTANLNNAKADNTNAQTPWVSKLAQNQLRLGDANVKQINEMVEKIRSDKELNLVNKDILSRSNEFEKILFNKKVDASLAELGATEEQSKVIIETFAQYQASQIALLVSQSYNNYAQGRSASENAVSNRISANAASSNARTNARSVTNDYLIRKGELYVNAKRAAFQNALDKSNISKNNRAVVESQLVHQWREDLNDVPIIGRSISGLLGIPVSGVSGLLK